jgi:hypothetical protein
MGCTLNYLSQFIQTALNQINIIALIFAKKPFITREDPNKNRPFSLMGILFQQSLANAANWPERHFIFMPVEVSR